MDLISLLVTKIYLQLYEPEKSMHGSLILYITMPAAAEYYITVKRIAVREEATDNIKKFMVKEECLCKIFPYQ